MFAAGKTSGGISSGVLYSWGDNTFGDLGLGTSFNFYLSPVQVGGATTWAEVAAGGADFSSGFTIARKLDGTLWGTGYNFYGQLGVNTNSNKLVFTEVYGGGTTWTTPTAGGVHALALKSNGTLWAWGDNSLGQLGLGVTGGSYYTPYQVGSATNWVSVSAGANHTAAVKSDGTLWAWGGNTNGQVGIGNTTSPQNSPVQVGTDTNWAAVSCGTNFTLALKTNNTLWAWGLNTSGQLGIGSTTSPQTSPTQIGTDTNWASVTAGGFHGIAIKTTGTAWSWGANTYGQLGIGNTTSPQTSPVQIGTDTDWRSSSNGLYHSLLLKTNRVLYACGDNARGQLGIGNTTQQTSPTLIGNINAWGIISASGEHSHGVIS